MTAGIVKRGRGQPVTLFAPGGTGDNLAVRMSYADRVKGTKIGFVYEQSGHFEDFRKIRRQAERDAAEVRALVVQHKATKAVGFSRGARAIAGALAEAPDLFERVVLAIPPGGTPPGKYAEWLESLSPEGRAALPPILLIGDQIDSGHPMRVAEEWADRLGARLEALPRRTMLTDVGRVADVIADFLN